LDQEPGLPRTTERPVRERRSTQRLSTGGDSPREIAARGVYKVLTEKIISRGECSELPARVAP
ncbi:MAG: hypothetical protein ACE5I0_03585, partial [Candidatus Binatia bacterium]